MRLIALENRHSRRLLRAANVKRVGFTRRCMLQVARVVKGRHVSSALVTGYIFYE